MRASAILPDKHVMLRAAIFLGLLTISGSASAQAPIIYGSPSSGPPASSRQDVSSAPQVELPPPNRVEAGAASAPQAETTALSDYALRREDVQPFDPSSPPRTHTIGANETLYDIATRYQIPMLALIEQNQLAPPYALSPGQSIELPPPRFHRVVEGESFEDIARRYSIDPRSLALLNRMQPPYVARPGDQFVLPAMAGRWQDTPSLAPIEIADNPPLQPPPIQTPAPPIARRGQFVWPVRGDIVARFGEREGGGRLDGVEIAAREGSPIGAAEEGDVVYSGADVQGYGTLVLIRHADSYVTAYAYARRALVREGQHVRAGEPIAEVGRTANGEARLMFQVRLGRNAVDPLPLLGQN